MLNCTTADAIEIYSEEDFTMRIRKTRWRTGRRHLDVPRMFTISLVGGLYARLVGVRCRIDSPNTCTLYFESSHGFVGEKVTAHALRTNRWPAKAETCGPSV